MLFSFLFYFLNNNGLSSITDAFFVMFAIASFTTDSGFTCLGNENLATMLTNSLNFDLVTHN